MKKLISILLVTVFLLGLICLPACGESGPSPEEQQQQYEQAKRYLRQENYDEAVKLFAALGNYSDSSSYVAYCDALSYCNSGDYKSAYDTIKNVSPIEEFKTLKRNIYYETRLLEGINDLSKIMKNPNSMSLTDVVFSYIDGEEACPSIVAYVSGQNGFGGYTLTYVALDEDETTGKYEYTCSTTTLNIDDADTTSEYYSILLINIYLDNSRIENAVNLNRINSLISNQKYKTVTKVTELTYEEISEGSSNV